MAGRQKISGLENGQVTFLDSTYREAKDLLIESRNYLAGSKRARHEWLDPGQRLNLSCETLRLTARLTQIMAWLLMQRAVMAGEVEPSEAAKEENRLSGQAVCGVKAKLPEGADPKVSELMARSLKLYKRIARLDSQLGEGR